MPITVHLHHLDALLLFLAQRLSADDLAQAKALIWATIGPVYTVAP